jgi:hypothetical protein
MSAPGAVGDTTATRLAEDGKDRGRTGSGAAQWEKVRKAVNEARSLPVPIPGAEAPLTEVSGVEVHALPPPTNHLNHVDLIVHILQAIPQVIYQSPVPSSAMSIWTNTERVWRPTCILACWVQAGRTLPSLSKRSSRN